MGIFFSGPGQTYSNSAFIDQYINDFGWSRTEVSSLYSTATLIAGLTIMFVGSINGVGMTMVVIGSSLGPMPFGAGFDIFHNYTLVLLASLIFPKSVSFVL